MDIIFPPTADNLRLRDLTPQSILSHYRPTRIDQFQALSQYLDHTIKAAITECKYQHSQHATTLLAALLHEWLITQPITPTLLLPVPLSAARLRTRGYNQVEAVCRRLTTHPHINLATTLLHRTRDTTPQTTLPRQERLQNMQRAFAIHPPAAATLREYEHIIICDDVLTTGATLAAARAAVAPHLPPHCQLTCIAWSH